MSDKIARLGIERDNDLMYFVKNGDVWAVPRKQPGQPKGKPRKIADAGLELDYSKYLYFVDGDGDVARKARNVGGGSRSSGKRAKTAAPKKAARTSSSKAPKAGGGREAQIAREVDECIAKVGGAAHARKRR